MQFVFNKPGKHWSVILSTLLLTCISISLMACNKAGKNKLTPVCSGGTATYDANVKTIINSKCVSCHSGYSSYSGLSGIISNGQFKKHVLTDQDMPENSSLKQDQINTIQCWVDAGYPQN